MPPIAIRFLVPPPARDGRSAHRPHPYIVLDKASPSSPSLPTPPASKRNASSRRSSSTTILNANAPITPSSLSAPKPSSAPPMSSQSRKRKASFALPSPTEQAGGEGKKAKMVLVRMKPDFGTILARCAAYDPTDDGHTVKPTHSSATKTYLHPYSPASDWGNFRSSKLSREEEVREERMMKAKKMGKEEKKTKMEGVMRVKELVKEMKVTMGGGVYVPPAVEEVVVDTPEGTPRPTAAKPGRGKKSLSPASISTRAKSHSPLATETSLVADALADPPKTVPLAAGKVKPGRPKKVTVVEAKERPSRSSGRTKEAEKS
ncbi:hypothetical protein I350_04601 [Cryptococcus amylolentus CBS 6273]|uniref:Uncharacterized protein n=1 Tax=Cryptococcus amylolentus CBS 6273 TaxID=1296118 RepID=A0A1E3JXI2_9TREE|nr:hypothetical protein I350_04601 [Cryptococcus amylolentus CBS 6273]